MNNDASILAQSKKEGHNIPVDQISSAAATLGAAGGAKGGPARADALSSERRKEIAYIAAYVRWHGEYPPDNLPSRIF